MYSISSKFLTENGVIGILGLNIVIIYVCDLALLLLSFSDSQRYRRATQCVIAHDTDYGQTKRALEFTLTSYLDTRGATINDN